MELGVFGKLIETVAPTIATALGGPVAGMAVKALSSALLGHGNGSEDDIRDALATATPDQIAAIRKVDADFKVQMKELDIDLERIAAGDRDSARHMQMNTNDWIPRVLAILITIGFFGILVWMLIKGMPPTGTEALLMMLGALGTAWTGVVNFYYGSSAGSKAKTDALTAKELQK
jgi:membrane-bound ClpP family serine protease